MEIYNSIKNKALEEREIDIKLKNYFNKMKNLVGDEYTYLTLSTKESIKDSIESFTKDFDNVDENEIVLSLLRSSVISNEDNEINRIVKKFIDKGAFEDLVTLVNCNLAFRKGLTKVFMNHAHESNLITYSKRTNENNTIGDLLSLIYFENSLSRSENKTKNMYIKKGM